MEKFDFYYRDSFDLSKAFPDADSFALEGSSDNIIIKDGCILLRDPEKLNSDSIHNKVRVYSNIKDFELIEVNIRCWREDGPRLKEVTNFLNFKKGKFYHLLKRIVKKVFKTGFDSILLTQDGVTYYTWGGRLWWRTKHKKGILSSQVKLERSEYNQMIKTGKFGFIRTGNCIYVSEDGLKTWNVAHEGTHALIKSMLWDENLNSLVFTNYTGGSERVRHYIRRYNTATKYIETLLTFYTKEEHEKQGMTPFARHIHSISEDPYTGDWYVAVGDYEDEPAIYRSTDKGQSFEKIGGGDQMWRTLSFIFRKDYILWGSDSESPQYLSCINREQLNQLPIKDNDVKRYPLFNSALWFTYDDGDITIMSSNSEGSLYDDCHRVYGITIDDKGVPTVYSLYKAQSDPYKNHYVYNQLFIQTKDVDGKYWFYDFQNNISRQFILKK